MYAPAPNPSSPGFTRGIERGANTILSHDNFHAGYNLCALKSISQFDGTCEFESHMRHGFEFYRKHFFRKDGAPKYFYDRTYPIDAHCVAQSIITLIALRDFDRGNVKFAHSVLSWAVSYMWDRQGYPTIESCLSARFGSRT